MTEEQAMNLGKYIEIEIGEDAQFLLVVIEKDSVGGSNFRAISNASKKNAQHILRIIEQDIKPQIEAQ